MRRSRVIQYIFEAGMVPMYAHRITGEKFLWDERWNRISYKDKDKARKLMIELTKKMRKVTREEDELMLDTGWVYLYDPNIGWEPEEFEINE